MFQEYDLEVYDEEDQKDQVEYADSFIESRILVDDTTTPKTTVQPVAMLTKPKPSKKREIDDTSDEYFETMKKQMLMTSFTGTPEDFGITPKVAKHLVKKPRIGNVQF